LPRETSEILSAVACGPTARVFKYEYAKSASVTFLVVHTESVEFDLRFTVANQRWVSFNVEVLKYMILLYNITKFTLHKNHRHINII